MAQEKGIDITGTQQKDEIDKLQHAFDPAHYPKKKEPPKEEEKKEEPGFVQRCINWVCSLFSSSEEEDKKEHDQALKEKIEEMRKAKESEKKLEAPKTEAKTQTKTETKSETKTTGFKPVETARGATKVLTTSFKVETAHSTPALKVEASHVEAFKSPSLKPASITETKSFATPAVHTFPAMPMPLRSASASLIKR
jgi:ferric-dicitrate binding protein FerR (iron transport regulator)